MTGRNGAGMLALFFLRRNGEYFDGRNARSSARLKVRKREVNEIKEKGKNTKSWNERKKLSLLGFEKTLLSELKHNTGGFWRF